MIRKALAGATALLLALGMAMLATTPAYAAGPQFNGNKVTICHSPSSASNPWVKQTISVNSMKEDGHIDPSLSDTHVDDIIPGFWYDVHVGGSEWQPVYYSGKNLTTLFGGYTGQEILDNNCVIPAPIAVTPEHSVTQENCVEGALVAGSISVTLKTGIVYTLTGPGGAIDLASGNSGPLAPGVYRLVAADSNPADKYAGGSLDINIVISAYNGECGEVEPEPVTPAFSSVDQQCVAGALVGGSITVDLSVPGVTYTITKNGAPVAFDPVTGKTGPLAPATDYLVEAADADATDGYVASPLSQSVTIAAHAGPCGTQPQAVTPTFSATDQECVEGFFDGGYITVDLSVPGVTYTITKGGMAVAFDPATGKTGPLAPANNYLVEAVDADAADGYVASPLSQAVTIAADDSGDCDPTTLPSVVPTVVFTEPTCAAPTGSYRLSNDVTTPGAADPAVFWTVEGAARAEGVSYSVAAGTTVTIVATANGPTYGFPGEPDGVIEFPHTFAAVGVCDLTTLALTGQQPTSPALAVAGFLGLLGVALVRAGRRTAAQRAEA